MDWTCVLRLIIILNILGISQAYFESCEQTVNIGANEIKIAQSLGYPDTGYVPGSSCRYTIVAPVDFQITATCYMNMYDPSSGSCSSERLYFAVDGKQDLSTSTYYCGSQNVTLTSNGNKLILAYVSNTYSGLFSCKLTTVCDCGWSSRIVGGTNATPNEFTPMVGIVSKTTSKIYCGATIVSPRYVANAAHCLRVTPQTNTVIVVGENDVSTGADSNYTAIYLVDSFIEYPTYSSVTNQNDLGLIKTTTTIVWSRAVSPACLLFYYASADFTGQIVTATGWGSQEYGGPSSNILKKVNLNVISNTNTLCTGSYPNVSNTQMCTYTQNKDTCQYDSGGPLFFRGPSNPRLFLLALVSAGDGCAASTPALDTRLASTTYLNWIESYTGSLCRKALS